MASRGPSDPKEAALRPRALPEPASRAGHRRGVPVRDFFDARDAVQVKYEMVRDVRVDGAPVTATAAAFGYSRPSYYQAAAALAEPPGWRGWCSPRPGPRGGHKLTEQILAWAEQQLAADPALRPPPGRAYRRGVRGARAPRLRRASAGPPAGAFQKPLTCPPPSAGRRRTRPCPCDLYLAPRLLNQARHSRARMPARLMFPAAGWMPATSSCVMPPCTHARARSRSGSACSPARASPPGGVPWPT